MNILIVTAGSRGDVQPYAALGAGLRAAGQRVTIAAGKNFAALVAEAGLEFAPLSVDFLQMVETPEGRAALAGGSPLGLMKKIMPMLRRSMDEAWGAAQGAEALIYHPKALSGYHIAEKLGVPAFLGFPIPLFSPTRAFPCPVFPVGSLGGLGNLLSYRLFFALSTGPYRRMINAWRRETLGLPPAGDELALRGRPLRRLYCYSEHVVPRPADWDEATTVTGYWFTNETGNWQPPAGLVEFLEAGPPPVYVGFGSMAGTDAERVTRTVLEALRLAGQRGVLASGWGGLKAEAEAGEFYALDSAPHEWLFPRMSAVVHHGGAGTTAAGLRAGRPTVVCPFFGDQPFWGRRVAQLGAGPRPVPQKRLTAGRLGEAIRAAVSDSGMQARAAALGEKIRAEDGVARAVQVILEEAG